MQTSPPQWEPGFWGACYMENHHPLRGHRRLKLERPNSTFKANSSDRRPGRAATHISAQEEDDHQMIHSGTSPTRRQNRIGSEVIRRLSDERLNCFFNVIFYIILDQRNLILCLLWICACCTTKFYFSGRSFYL